MDLAEACGVDGGTIMLKGVVFAMSFIGVFQLIQIIAEVPRDESWLVAACLAVFVVNLIPPVPESRLSSIRTNLLIVYGAYVLGLKIPKLFTGFVNTELLSAICFLVYFVICFLWIQRRRRIETL